MPLPLRRGNDSLRDVSYEPGSAESSGMRLTLRPSNRKLTCVGSQGPRAMVARDLSMYLESIGMEFPDCTVRRFNGHGWEQLAVEFEFDSNSFRAHGHDPAQCDMIVCWTHNWIDCPADIEVIALADEIKKLPNTPIQRPERMPF